MKFEKAPVLFLSEVFDVVAVVVACLSSLLKLSTEPSRCILCTNQNLAAGLAQSVERSTEERMVAGLIPGAGPILKVLK